jgi:histidyl-tRNA synthetase
VRWCYDLDMFRRERPQRGRWRQFRQIGAELFTGPVPAQRAAGDVELVVLAQRVVSRALGAERAAAEVRLQINTLGDAESRKAYNVVLRDFLESQRGSLSASGVARLDRGALLRVLDSQQDKAVVANAPSIVDHLTPAASEYWARVREGLRAAGVVFELAPQLVRGLDYYQDTVWELVHGGETLGAQQATVLAGGRYDSLVAQVARGMERNGASVAAAGWAMGVDRLLLLLEGTAAHKQTRAPVAVLGLLPAKEAHAAVRLCCCLADAGVAAELLVGSSVRQLLGDASRRGAQWTLLLGSDELAAERVTLKNMATGAQEVLSWVEATRRFSDKS